MVEIAPRTSGHGVTGGDVLDFMNTDMERFAISEGHRRSYL
jgi:hypothetical protein